jgi:hypothetical protein
MAGRLTPHALNYSNVLTLSPTSDRAARQQDGNPPQGSLSCAGRNAAAEILSHF